MVGMGMFFGFYPARQCKLTRLSMVAMVSRFKPCSFDLRNAVSLFSTAGKDGWSTASIRRPIPNSETGLPISFNVKELHASGIEA